LTPDPLTVIPIPVANESGLKFEAVIIMAHASGAVINIALDKYYVKG
jgi:hypothetical protein